MRRGTDDPLAVLADRGQAAYVGEPVTIATHCLQTAALAQAANASDALVVAALFHDIGHLLHAAGEDATVRGVDPVHEAIGARYLADYFGPAVFEPVRLHVLAKRYLCATRAGYHQGLSRESRETLELQGGPMTADEAAAFLSQPFARGATQLRLWDDQAKDPHLPVPGLEHYADRVRALRRSGT